MKVFLWGLSFFIATFILHLIIWRIRLPKRQLTVLLLIFLAGFVACVLTFRIYACAAFKYCLLFPESILEYFHVCLLFMALSLAYIVSYAAIAADSPSLVMVQMIKEAGKDGLSQEKIDEMVNDDLLVGSRIRDLVNAKLVSQDKGKYQLTSKGSLFVRIFILYRTILKAQKGG